MRRAAIALVAVLISSCASIEPPTPVSDPQQAWFARQARLSTITHWEIRGRLGVRARQRKKSGQATVIWARDGERHNIRLYGPLGRGTVILTQDAAGATLRDSKKKTYAAANARTLLNDTVGWDIPFDQLQYWLTGAPDPTVPMEVELDGQGRLKTLRQAGWNVRFLEYRRYQEIELPRKVYLSARPAPALSGQGVEVRVVIKRWGLQL